MSFINIPRPPKSVLSDVNLKALSNIDKELLKQLLDIFDGNFINFYKNHDFRSKFRHDYVSKLNLFCISWDDVTHEFIDVDMEANKKQLYKASSELATIISTNTAVLDEYYSSVYPDNLMYTELDRKRFEAEAKQINDGCTPFVTVCESFIRYTKRRLAES